MAIYYSLYFSECLGIFKMERENLRVGLGGCFPGAQSMQETRGEEITRIPSDRGSRGCSRPTEESG